MSAFQLVTLTQNAQNALVKMLDETEGVPLGVRVNIKTKGCSGLSWELEIAREKNEFDDNVSINNKYTLFIDKKATLFILGTTLDYIENDLESGFVFNNPKEKGKCGCGESFYV